MQEIEVTKNEAGLKLKKVCMTYLSLAPSSFIYKMLRKKNIVLNDKKADGNEILLAGDIIKLYLSDDTIEKFRVSSIIGNKASDTPTKERPKRELDIIYEDDNYIFCNKGVNVLSQKAKPEDYSINEMILDYLLDKGDITEESLQTFHPSICNRLDRNTSGIIMAAKTPHGAHYLSDVLKNRTVKKYYFAIVTGKADLDGDYTAYMLKDEATNKVTISKVKMNDAKAIETNINILDYNPKADVTLLMIELKTGKSHQIRAHLSSLGYPIVGDVKYGSKTLNAIFNRKYGIKSQMLSSVLVVFPEGTETISARRFSAKPLKAFYKLFDVDSYL